MRILAIETSCDETALALIEAQGRLPNPKFKVLKNIVSSQTDIHAHWGGVVPNLAKREHIKNLPILFKELALAKIDLLAVTVGPGLEPALWTGINFAKEIHKNVFPKTKFIGINHLEGHLFSAFLSPQYKKKKLIKFPAIGLVISGGHTILLYLKSMTQWKKLGETRDDAVGECFDKVARMLNLPYPGGPQIEKIARDGNPTAIDFPKPMINQKNYDFSFSGLKTSVLYYLRDNPDALSGRGSDTKSRRSQKISKADVAASFQKAAVDVLVAKTMNAAANFGAKSILVSGGVATNGAIRKALQTKSRKAKKDFYVSDIKFNTDNASMIAVAAYINYLQKKNRPIKANSNLNL